MSSSPPRSTLIALVGPTGSGKSALAVEVALRLGCEVVNCDSMQLYRRLNIGTAKPTDRQRSLVPHHLYDVIEPDELYSAGRYMLEARTVCREISERGKTPLVVGGTGLYLRALLLGVFEGPGRSDELRRRLHRIADRKGSEYLHRLLSRRDPPAAARIEPADRIRLVRALEVFFATGSPISQLQPARQPFEPFSIVKIGLNLPRSELYARINRRVEEMFQSGLIEEVSALLQQGYSPDLKAFEALGYRAVVRVLRRDITLLEAVELTQRETRRYAKRQMTWFRKEEGMNWIPYAGEDPRAVEEVVKAVEE
ncbi:MAG: tRNA (adenosine(37)-N6)-dimethylallyltransferase MiaA [Acidobacteria bacterium]|nr:MAG: tRNA (adenosine(37)-N6)-dimethylallyltransferase MiaA [Acidobacteriota bacterium]